MHICVSENRVSDEIAVKLLILSLAEHEPTAVIHLFINELSADFTAWVRNRLNVVLENVAFEQNVGWNIKPSLLTLLVERGIASVVWIDSDVIITSSISRFFDSLPLSVLVAAPEPFFSTGQGVVARARDWHLDAVRDFPHGISSSILRVTPLHLPLLRKWQEMLTDPVYRQAQKMPFSKRPAGMAGDQDVLVALLSSIEFATLEIRSLILGTDIAQCFFADGFGPLERLRNIDRLPPFVHAQGPKPWRQDIPQEVHLELSPYRYAAENYRNVLTPSEINWLASRSRSANFYHTIALGDASLAGLIPAIVKRGRRIYRSFVKRKSSAIRQPSAASSPNPPDSTT